MTWPVLETDGCMTLEQQGPEPTWVADSLNAIKRDGWVVLSEENFKPGVRRISCVKGNEFRMVYIRKGDGCGYPDAGAVETPSDATVGQAEAGEGDPGGGATEEVGPRPRARR